MNGVGCYAQVDFDARRRWWGEGYIIKSCRVKVGSSGLQGSASMTGTGCAWGWKGEVKGSRREGVFITAHIIPRYTQFSRHTFFTNDHGQTKCKTAISSLSVSMSKWVMIFVNVLSQSHAMHHAPNAWQCHSKSHIPQESRNDLAQTLSAPSFQQIHTLVLLPLHSVLGPANAITNSFDSLLQRQPRR